MLKENDMGNRLAEEINRAVYNHQQVMPLTSQEEQPPVKQPHSAELRAQVRHHKVGDLPR